MRAVLKKDHEKSGHIPSYEVLTVYTDGGVWKADEMYFYDYDEDADYLCWEKRRYEIAKMAMTAMLASPALMEVVTNPTNVVEKSFESRIAKLSAEYADALIAELKKKGE